jgi:uncharacterized protein
VSLRRTAALVAAAIIMQYDILGELRRGDGPKVVEVDDPAPSGTGLRVLGPVTGVLTLTNTGAAIAAQGTLHARVVMECSRCLKAHEVALDIAVNELCSLTQIDEPPMDQVGEDAAPIPILEADTVDLTELVRQLLTLNAPERSLCRPDCRGLCPVCGRDLNEGPCSCADDDIDPRLAGLRDVVINEDE